VQYQKRQLTGHRYTCQLRDDDRLNDTNCRIRCRQVRQFFFFHWPISILCLCVRAGGGDGSGSSRCIIGSTVPASRNTNEKPREAFAQNNQNPGQDLEAGHVRSGRATQETVMFGSCTVTVEETGPLEANENWKK